MSDLSKIIARAQKQGVSETVSRGKEATIPLNNIKDRTEDTRQLNDAHVNSLAESIAVLGLIEPLVTDKNHVLLAGGHRKAAIAHIRETRPTAYQKHFSDGVPVRVMDFDAVEEPERALEIEVAENEQRRDYTPSEVKALADRLLSTGRYHGSRGRPPEGKTALMEGLLPIVGKSRATIQRYLEEPKQENASNEAINSDKHLKTAIAALKKWEQARGRKRREVELAKELPAILERLESAIDET